MYHSFLVHSSGDGHLGCFHVLAMTNSIETCILSRVKQIAGPGWMHETSARTWCSGRTWRERVEREVGGGIGMGKTCEPKAYSFQCMTKFTTNKNKNKNKNKSLVNSTKTQEYISSGTADWDIFQICSFACLFYQLLLLRFSIVPKSLHSLFFFLKKYIYIHTQ